VLLVSSCVLLVFVVGCWLLVVGCWLLVVGFDCLLFTNFVCEVLGLKFLSLLFVVV